MSAAAARRFDPANDTHVAISEESEYQLRRIAEAAEAIRMLFDGLDQERAELPDDGPGAILATVSYAIAAALADRAVVFPGKR